MFRVDASRDIGTGHMMRCLTLARAFAARGASVLFLCRSAPGDLAGLAEAFGFTVVRLAPLPALTDGEARVINSRIAADDARHSIHAMDGWGEGGVDWLVVDHYRLDERWERALRSRAARVMVIDDLADRPHASDLLVDQNLVGELNGRYDQLVPQDCVRLLGPTYAILQPEYAEMRSRAVPRMGTVRKVLIFFGGTDQGNMTYKSLKALLSLNTAADVQIDVVVGATNSTADGVREIARGQANVQIHESVSTLAPLMLAADLALGGGGATSWERLCLGLPALVVTVAENQVPIAEELHRSGLVRWMGKQNEVDEPMMVRAIGAVLRDGLDETWSRRCMEAVDGRGAERVLAAMEASTEPFLTVRRVTQDDEAILLEWANDPKTRQNAFNPDAIPASVHHSWLMRQLRDVEGCRFYIAEGVSGAPVGQVRFQREGQEWEVHYAVAPAHRGLRLGRTLLRAALEQLRGERAFGNVFGQVKAENGASRRIFEELGFEKERDLQSGSITYRRAL